MDIDNSGQNKHQFCKRQSLSLGDEQLSEEMLRRTQNFFHPDEICEPNDLEYFKSLFKCEGCKQIPLDIEYCIECDKVLCIPCQQSIEKKSKQGLTQKKCPSQECCNSEIFEFTKIKNKTLIKLIKELTERHCCALPFQVSVSTPNDNQQDDQTSSKEDSNKSGQLSQEKSSESSEIGETIQPQSTEIGKEGLARNVFEMKEHLEKECTRNRTCFNCERIFSTNEEFQAHIKFGCDFVEVKCHVCSETFSRKDFRLHGCYIQQSLQDLCNPYNVEDQVHNSNDVQALTEMNNLSEAKVHDLQRENENLQVLVNILRNQLQQSQMKVQAIVQEKEEVQSMLTEKDQKLQEFTADQNQIQSIVQSLTSDNSRLKREAESSNGEFVAEIEKITQAKEHELAVAQKQKNQILQKQVNKTREANKKVQDHEIENEILKNDVKVAKREQVEFKSRLQEMIDENDILKSAQEKEDANQVSQVQSLQADVKHLKQVAQESMDKLQLVTKEKEKLQQQSRESDQKLSFTHKELNQIRNKLKTLQAENKRNCKQKDDMTQDLTKMSEAIIASKEGTKFLLKEFAYCTECEENGEPAQQLTLGMIQDGCTYDCDQCGDEMVPDDQGYHCIGKSHDLIVCLDCYHSIKKPSLIEINQDAGYDQCQIFFDMDDVNCDEGNNSPFDDWL